LKRIFFLQFFCAFFCLHDLSAFTVSGKVTDEKNQPIPFASIYVKGTTRGTNSNMQGAYSIDLPSGNYELVFKYIGYKQHIEQFTISGSNLDINVKLVPESIELKAAVIEANGEDPAYAIIRQAQKKRKFYLEQVDAYSCDVYIKGEERVLKKPKKIMGLEVDPEGDIDSTTGIVYLSESVSKFNFKQKDKIKEEMISSKVSGDNKAFSYNQASDMFFNFYQNLLQVAELSERGFISPISSNAMLSYKYKLLGAFVEDGKLIHQIQVIPKRKTDPVFSGIINIMDESWRIHSLKLVLTKAAQIDFVDTLRIDQVFVPVDKEVWMPISNKFTFDFGVLGIKGDGMFIGVNSNYVINPDYPKHFFTNEVMKINDDANKKDSAYWKDSRPIPLTHDEETDYRRRDSINRIKRSQPYMDSVDRKANHFKFRNLFFAYNHRNSFKKENWYITGPVLGAQFNTVLGYNLGMGAGYSKRFEDNRFYNIGGNLGYGFSNKDFYGNIFAHYTYNPQKFAGWNVAMGRSYTQFNNHQPVIPLLNTFYSLLNGQNFMKLYVNNYASMHHTSELVNGLYFSPGLGYAQRITVQNTTSETWVKTSNRYTSNNPQDSLNQTTNPPNSNALTFSCTLHYVFKQRYYTAPHVKTVTGSKYPSLTLYYKKGLNVSGSDVDYDLLTLSLEGKLNLKLLGNSQYLITAGDFLNSRKMYYMDWYHFQGNQTFFSGFALADFQLLDYYTHSTKDKFVEGHFEHNFGGFILNKIPLIKRLKMQEIGKISILTTDGKNSYAELSAGLERFMVRVDFIAGFSNQTQVSTGFRLGIKFN
jgi:hypothetical protein